MAIPTVKNGDAMAPKLMIYGLPGVGKSTLAATLSKPLFMDFEGGLNYIKGVERTPQITSIRTFYEYLVELKNKPKDPNYDTIVVDSADWMVRKIVEQAAGIDNTHLTETLNKSNGGYGNGAQVLENHIRTWLLPLFVMLNVKGYGICLIAHADKKTIMTADGVDLEQITPKIDAKTMNFFVEWCDNVIYLKKDIDGSRVMLLESDGVALAKNRLGLTGERTIDDKFDINKLLSAKEK